MSVVETTTDFRSNGDPMSQIDEILGQYMVTVLERAIAFERCKTLYERLYPETKHGGVRGNQHAGAKVGKTTNLSFCQMIAEKTGVSSKTVERAVAIAKNLRPEIRDRIAHHPIADNASELTRLGRYHHVRQGEIVALLSNRRSGVVRVRQAIDHLEGRAPILAPSLKPDIDFQRFETLWNRVGQRVRNRIIRFIEQAEGGRFIRPGRVRLIGDDEASEA